MEVPLPIVKKTFPGVASRFYYRLAKMLSLRPYDLRGLLRPDDDRFVAGVTTIVAEYFNMQLACVSECAGIAL